MKKNLLASLMFAAMLHAAAQTALPNAGFETWTSNGPENWNTNNINGSFEPITVSTDARTGAFAIKGAATTYMGNTLSPNLGTYSNSPFPITQQYATLNFYYKMHRAGANEGLIITGTIFDASNNPVGLINHKISAETNTYTAASVPIIWVGSNPADMNLLIGFEDTTGTGNVTQGSYYLLDDFSLGGGATSVDETETNLPAVSVFPNPATNAAWTIVADKQWLGCRMELYNLEGKLVYAGQVTDASISVGADLPAGIYTLQLTGKDMKLAQKLSRL